jgi:plasmid stabilization system protein ParE
VATVVYSAGALAHIEHALARVRRDNPDVTDAAVQAISSAAALLAEHPLVGRRLRGDIREMVISIGPTGHVALYRFLPVRREVRILALRHQGELHYRP